jgi:acyl-CoA reductase-like NAD-dependent aldehyde dehydrogenase
VQTKLLINGRLVAGEGKVEDVLNPATGKVLARVAVGKALNVASRLQYGCTWINTHFMLVSEMPHGGLKRSGYGKDLSAYALEDYTVVRHVMAKL